MASSRTILLRFLNKAKIQSLENGICVFPLDLSSAEYLSFLKNAHLIFQYRNSL